MIMQGVGADCLIREAERLRDVVRGREVERRREVEVGRELRGRGGEEGRVRVLERERVEREGGSGGRLFFGEEVHPGLRR